MGTPLVVRTQTKGVHSFANKTKILKTKKMDTRVFNVCRVCMIQEKSIPFKPFFDGRYPKYLEWITGLKVSK